MDAVMEAWDRDPGMHVYHYTAYEPSALKRLMGRYGTRETELDRLLRGGRLVDLYGVARQGIRASVERYSLKDLEAFAGYERKVDLRQAGMARRRIEAVLDDPGLEMPGRRPRDRPGLQPGRLRGDRGAPELAGGGPRGMDGGGNRRPAAGAGGGRGPREGQGEGCGDPGRCRRSPEGPAGGSRLMDRGSEDHQPPRRDAELLSAGGEVHLLGTLPAARSGRRRPAQGSQGTGGADPRYPAAPGRAGEGTGRPVQLRRTGNGAGER